MKYLCLVYVEESRLEALSQGARDSLAADSLAYEEDLRKSRHYIASSALHPLRSATTLQARAGGLSITDGVAAETGEQLSGFILIAAKDLNDALHAAANIPSGRLGRVEVRPVVEPEPSQAGEAVRASGNIDRFQPQRS
jgi:hypothetical protein